MNKAGIAVLCAYEIIAVATGKVPPITDLCRRHRAAEAILIAWLLIHFHRKSEEQFLIEFYRRRHA